MSSFAARPPAAIFRRVPGSMASRTRQVHRQARCAGLPGLGLFLAAIGACASPAGTEPITIPREPAVEAGDEVGAGLDRLRAAYTRGDEEAARGEIASLRAGGVPSNVDAYLTQFQALLDGRALARGLQRLSRLEADRDPVAFGDPVTMRLVLAGDAGAGRTGEIAIAASVGGGLFSSRPRTLTRIVANVSTRDLDAYGGETSRSDTIFVDPRGDLRIPPGGEAALEFSFEGLTNPGVAARSVEVAVEVVPAETCLDGEPVYLTRFAVPACTVLALPAEYAGFAADPLTALGEILARPDAAADRSILPCALTVPREKRDDAIRTLAGKLIGAESPRSLAIIAALRELTGERDRGLDRAAWIGFASKVLTSARR